MAPLHVFALAPNVPVVKGHVGADTGKDEACCLSSSNGRLQLYLSLETVGGMLPQYFANRWVNRVGLRQKYFYAVPETSGTH